MDESVTNLQIGSYARMLAIAKKLGDRAFDCDHIPSMATIKAYAKLRYGLTLPTDDLDEVRREYLVEELAHNLLQRTVFWQELSNHALTWILPFEVHKNHSRTYQSRCNKALESDWNTFVDELDTHRLALDLSIDDITHLREPSLHPEQVQRIMNAHDLLTKDTIGARYLRIAIDADVAALRKPIVEHYAESGVSRQTMHAEIDRALDNFLGHIPQLDKVLKGRVEAENLVRHSVRHVCEEGLLMWPASGSGRDKPPPLRAGPAVDEVLAKHGGKPPSPGRRITVPAQTQPVQTLGEHTITPS